MKLDSIVPVNNNTISYKNRQSNTQRANIKFGQSNDTFWDSYCFWGRMRDGDFKYAEYVNDNDFNPNYANGKTGIPLLAAIYTPSILGKMQIGIDFWYVNKLKRKAIDKIVFHPDFNPFLTYLDKKNGCERNYFTDAVKKNDDYLLKMLFISCVRKQKRISERLYNDLSDLAKSKKIKEVLDICRPKADDGIPYGTRPEIADMYRRVKASHPDSSSEQADNTQPQNYDSNTDDFKLSSIKKKFPEVPATLDDLGGMQDAKKIIRDFIILPWGTEVRDKLKKNNISMPNGFLMYGPPGCGKTYITKVIANQTGFPMYEVDLATIGGSEAYITQNRLKKIFTELETKYKKDGVPNILFLDEIDSIGASRKIGHTDWKKDEINTLISLINNVSEKGIILIGATNLLENVDEAVLRAGRFDKKIYIGLPDTKNRKDIFDKMISKIPVAQPLAKKTDILAELTKGKSNAELFTILNECCREAICHNKETISLEDFKKTMANMESFKQEKTISLVD